MKKLEIRVTTRDEKDESPVSVLVEEKTAAGAWNRIDGKDLTTNDQKGMTLEVRPGQRVVIEAFVTPEAVYDHTQGAAVNPTLQSNATGMADKPSTQPPRAEAAPKATTPPAPAARTVGETSKPQTAASPPHEPFTQANKVGGVTATNDMKDKK